MAEVRTKIRPSDAHLYPECFGTAEHCLYVLTPLGPRKHWVGARDCPDRPLAHESLTKLAKDGVGAYLRQEGSVAAPNT